MDSVTLTCPSANTYLVIIKPECSKAVEASLRARGEVILDTKVVMGVHIEWMQVTFIKPSRLHITIPREKSIDEALKIIFTEE